MNETRDGGEGWRKQQRWFKTRGGWLASGRWGGGECEIGNQGGSSSAMELLLCLCCCSGLCTCALWGKLTNIKTNKRQRGVFNRSRVRRCHWFMRQQMSMTVWKASQQGLTRGRRGGGGEWVMDGKRGGRGMFVRWESLLSYSKQMVESEEQVRVQEWGVKEMEMRGGCCGGCS